MICSLTFNQSSTVHHVLLSTWLKTKTFNYLHCTCTKVSNYKISYSKISCDPCMARLVGLEIVSSHQRGHNLASAHEHHHLIAQLLSSYSCRLLCPKNQYPSRISSTSCNPYAWKNGCVYLEVWIPCVTYGWMLRMVPADSVNIFRNSM